jgi:hypothetical protein
VNKGLRERTHEQWVESVYGRIVPVGECEEWQGAMRRTFPMMSTPAGYAYPDVKQSYVSVRVWLWAQEAGARPDDGLMIRMKCRNDRCCKLDHMVLMTPTQSVKESAKRGQLATPKALAAWTRGARKKATKLNLDIARQIRNSDASSTDEAKKWGVSPQAVRQVRNGEIWRENAANSSVFNWRGAA